MVSAEKQKKPRSEAQIAAFALARERRAENLKKKQDEKAAPPAKVKSKAQPKTDKVLDTIIENEIKPQPVKETRHTVDPFKKASKPIMVINKPKPQLEVEYEAEPVPQKKLPRKKPVKKPVAPVVEKVEEVESDDNIDLNAWLDKDTESESEEEIIIKKKAPIVKKKAPIVKKKKKIIYQEETDSDDEVEIVKIPKKKQPAQPVQKPQSNLTLRQQMRLAGF